MDSKKKTKKIKFHNKHHKIMNNNNNKDNNNLNNKEYNYDYFHIKRNNIKIFDNINSSNLKDYEKGPIHPEIILRNSNQNNKIRSNYFNFPYEKNSNSNINDNNYNINKNENKMILEQKKRNKISLKEMYQKEEEEVEDEDQEEDENIEENIFTYSDKESKLKFRKIDKIFKEHNIKNRDNNNNMNEEQLNEVLSEKSENEENEEHSQDISNDNNNDDVFFYNGCDNFMIKENYKNNQLNNRQILNINPNQLTSFTTINTLTDQLKHLNKPKIEVNNYFNSNSINFQKIYSKGNSQSMNSLCIKRRRPKKKNQKVYKKKVTKNSLSVNRNNSKIKNKIINKSLSKPDFNYFDSTKIKLENIPILTEGNKAYFKINTSFNNSNNKNESNLYNSRKNKNNIYKKPNKMRKNLSNLHQSSKFLNDNKNKFNFFNEENDSYEDENEIQEKKINIEDIKYKVNENTEIRKDKKSLIISKDQKEEDNSLFSKSLEEPNRIGPRISIHKQKKYYNNFYYTLDKSSEENNNRNTISFKDIVSPMESIESCRFINEDKNNSKRTQKNNYSIQKNNDNLVHLPISESEYITKEKKIIIKYRNINENTENKSNKQLNTQKNLETKKIINKTIKHKKPKKKNIDKSNENITNNNNYIPIKKNEEKNYSRNNIFNIPKEMLNKLDETLESNNNNIKQENDNKNNKINFSYDSKKINNKNNKLNNLIKSSGILSDKEEIENEKIKRYKIRSVVKVIKKNKTFKYLSQNKISKEEENDIKEKIKLNKEQSMEDKIRNDKIVTILKEDIENFISFYNKKNDKENIEEKNIEDKKNKKYNWSIIEQLIIKAKVDIIDIINCFLLICNEIIENKNKLKIWNKYINKIIEHYKNNYLNESNIKTIHIKILKILNQIDIINLNKKYKYEILGNLFYQFLSEGLFCEEDLNYFENKEKKFILDLAKLIKFILIIFCKNSQLANEYHDNFKNTKIFKKNPIYFNHVTKYFKSSLNNKFDINV